jgi:hypothetical protein
MRPCRAVRYIVVVVSLGAPNTRAHQHLVQQCCLLMMIKSMFDESSRSESDERTVCMIFGCIHVLRALAAQERWAAVCGGCRALHLVRFSPPSLCTRYLLCEQRHAVKCFAAAVDTRDCRKQALRFVLSVHAICLARDT